MEVLLPLFEGIIGIVVGHGTVGVLSIIAIAQATFIYWLVRHVLTVVKDATMAQTRVAVLIEEMRRILG